ncbi:unnamed protein product [Blepharisma stoltei]|uniref:Uncharacterized protein n=1 Tax=Blepharisma stoltei TaxID=1481888 RepID=A0AAU9IU13_9CILI|nr:unnamed protein product [Blepharisma stoltei]
MRGFKKFFAKKDKDPKEADPEGNQAAQVQDGYVVMESSNLYNLSTSDLCEIIYKFDNEVKLLNSQNTVLTEQLSTSKKDLTNVQDQTKCYKEHIEALELELTKVKADLANTQNLFEQKGTEIQLLKEHLNSKDELVSNYKKQNEDLQDQISALRSEIAMRPESSGNCCVDKEVEIKNLKAEINKLRANILENNKLGQEIQELKLANRMLDSENQKNILQLENQVNQNKNLNEKIFSLEKLHQEGEIENHKKTIEIESIKRENARLMFQRDSSETEIRSLKDNLEQKEKALQKKQAKIEELQEKLAQKSREYSAAEYTLETQKKESIDLNGKLLKKISEIESSYKESLENADIQIRNLKSQLEGIKETSTGNNAKLFSVESENKDFQEKLKNYQEECASYQAKVLELEVENKKISDKLNKSNQKRDLARKEIIKLSQKLDQKSEGNSSSFSHNPEDALNVSVKSITPPEFHIIEVFKSELENLYKLLMKMMMEGNQLSKKGETIYTINSADFSTFERKLNDIVMQIHETMDIYEASSHNRPSSERSWSSMLNGAISRITKGVGDRGPSKMFSCMSNQEDPNENLVLRPQPNRKQPVRGMRRDQVRNHKSFANDYQSGGL